MKIPDPAKGFDWIRISNPGGVCFTIFTPLRYCSMKNFMGVCVMSERSLAKEAVYTEEMVETTAGTVLVAYSGDR